LSVIKLSNKLSGSPDYAVNRQADPAPASVYQNFPALFQSFSRVLPGPGVSADPRLGATHPDKPQLGFIFTGLRDDRLPGLPVPISPCFFISALPCCGADAPHGPNPGGAVLSGGRLPQRFQRWCPRFEPSDPAENHRPLKPARGWFHFPRRCSLHIFKKAPRTSQRGLLCTYRCAMRSEASSHTPASLADFATRLRAMMVDAPEARPFVCEGSPLAAGSVFIVGSQPATDLPRPFWSYWDPGYRFSKWKWFKDYKRHRVMHGKNPASQTRRRIERIICGLGWVRAIDTNIYAVPEESASKAASTAIFDFLLRSLKPKLILVYGDRAAAHLPQILRIPSVPQVRLGRSQSAVDQQCRFERRETCLGPILICAVPRLFLVGLDHAYRLGTKLRLHMECLDRLSRCTLS
jgi:hypothetical protein